jgi:glutathione-specific gamma-glutamylcyclotransferase
LRWLLATSSRKSADGSRFFEYFPAFVASVPLASIASASALRTSASPLWLFAYGSLLWRPGFAYEQRVRGYAPGWARRFWQHSTDHRGVPEQPGRVVTLVPAVGEQCWGVAYRVANTDSERVLAELDQREQGGYTLQRIPFVAKDRSYSDALEPLVYVAQPGNPNYAGEAPLTAIAQQVSQARGPSGHNVEYVLLLAESLSELGVLDEHVFELANLLADPDDLVQD